MNNLNILYIDSDKELKKSLSSFIKSFKSVDFCIDAKEALILYKTKVYDIVITDVDIDGMDGLLLSQKILCINQEQNIIILTANQDIKNSIKSMELGIKAYLLKPFDKSKVLQTILKIQEDYYLKKESLKIILAEQEKLFLQKNSYDNLTNLYNNIAFNQKIKENKLSNIILLNIDHFSNINDVYGCEIGDETLVNVSKYLKLITPSIFTLYRLESDIFVMLSESNLEDKHLVDYAQSIISFFNQTEITIEDEIDAQISFSVGISTGKGMSTLNQAKIAIKELRKHRRGHYKVYDTTSEYLHKQNDNIYWIHKIRDALSNTKLVPYFQPIINNHTKKIEKYECLARIEEGEEVISPILFMKAAKLTGTLHFVTKSMIEQSFKYFSVTDFEFSINITYDDLGLDYLEDFLIRNSKKYNISPSRIVLEILEDITSLHELNILSQLNSLRKKGFKIAIDDFGSKSSNFSRLIEFNPDYLKIDGSFIKNIVDDEKSQVITEAIVLICKKNNIKVIAEYIHNEDVQKKVEKLGIDYSQGYYFGEPSKKI